jgi:ATP-binding cassette subfamily B protein
MDYTLNISKQEQKKDTWQAVKKLLALIKGEKKSIAIATMFTLVNAGLSLLGPFLMAKAIDRGIAAHDFHIVLRYGLLMLGMYLLALLSSYLQTWLMGGVGQRTLFTLRNALFTKLEELPVAFFNQNKAGDLISRLNNDTDKLNQFFSQSLVQFIGNLFVMIGAGVFLVALNWKLGLAVLVPGVLVFIVTRLLSPWIKQKNAGSLKATGGLSAEIQESINNFKVVIAFNRRDYFRQKFNGANIENYNRAIGAGVANNTLTPVYGIAANFGQLIVLVFGISLIAHGEFSLGLLISFFTYVTNFYNPLRFLAALWSSFQTALAGWDRISQILALENNLMRLHSDAQEPNAPLLEFKDVSFKYVDSPMVLEHTNLSFQKGKTYALVGPTGGGKSTTASLIARLFDPSEGTVLLDGKDIRTYADEARVQKIGFILQEPLLFSGSVKDNLVFGNPQLAGKSENEIDELLEKLLHENDLHLLLERFDKGLETPVAATGESMSIGQRQLIAFMRAVLRKPELLILDEATANIDTVTEKLLDDILGKLPKDTTRVIIAHRLNTIENADEIYFVNGGAIVAAGSMEHAVDMLLHDKRTS